MRVGVAGRPGAGRRAVRRALRGAGIAVADADGADAADVDVYVFVETLNTDDRAVLAAPARPTVAVLNKADLAGFPAPMALAADRCRTLRREMGVPVCPLSALLAIAGSDPAVLDGRARDAVHTLAAGAPAGIPPEMQRRLAAELDVYGTALAVAALRGGAAGTAIPELLSKVSGIADVVAEIDRAAAVVRYQRLSDAGGPARIAAAVAVLDAAGAPAPRVAPSDHLGRALHWQRYARGPVSPLHRACAQDAARGALRLWTRAGGVPAGLP